MENIFLKERIMEGNSVKCGLIWTSAFKTDNEDERRTIN
jgi:hypothetical protein